MSTNIIICIFIALSLVLCPLAALGESQPVFKNKHSDVVAQEDKSEEYISVMLSETGEINGVDIREYIIGCIAAEMPASYHTEALKAQAVACYTYALRNKKMSGDKEADITDNPDLHQGYIGQKERKEKWGDKYEEYERKIAGAADDVMGYYMTYEEKIILAVYHSNSAGRTQSAENIWGSEIPYLSAVESPGDKLAPDFIEEKIFTEKEFRKCAEKLGVKLTDEPSDWVGKITRDDGGYVKTVVLGDEEISASAFRKEYDLRSPCFYIDYDGKFSVLCRGYGHGVGMSQYGADYMARQGFGWQEILRHYYTGVEFKQQFSG